MLYVVHGMERNAWIHSRRFFLEAHVMPGYTGPYEVLRDFLVQHDAASVECLEHPLNRSAPSRTTRRRWHNGQLEFEQSTWRPNTPPFSFLLDTAFRSKYSADVVVAFDVLSIARNALLSRIPTCVGWHVDFVPKRRDALSRLYQALDAFGHRRVDLEVDLTAEASDARAALHGGTAKATAVLPMGIWPQNVALRSGSRNLSNVVYVGALEARTTSNLLPSIIETVFAMNSTVTFDVVGLGPELAALERISAREPRLRLHGYLPDDAVLRLLNTAGVGLAPYAPDPNSFSWYADPGKVKMYLGAGLPTLITSVPPVHAKIRTSGAGTVLDPSASPKEWAHAILSLLSDPSAHIRASLAAAELAQAFYWPVILDSFIDDLMTLETV